jgi:hypothetical protein
MVRKYKYLQGADVTLDIAILEYGLAWFDDPDSDEIEFFYGIENQGEDYIRFDNACLKRDVDPKKEWNWVTDWNEIAEYCGSTVAEFLAMPLHWIVQTMIQYHGAENIFGATNWGAWTWNKNLQRFQ